jgi:hypothetical protein
MSRFRPEDAKKGRAVMEGISPHLLFLAVMVLAALTVLVSRLSSRFRGSLQAAREAEEEFTDGEVDSGFRYYAAGSEARPAALLMVRRDWELEGGWRELSDPARDLPAAVEGMQRQAAERSRPLHGFDLLDSQGTRVGSWYGPLGPRPMVRFREGGRLFVETPPVVHEP